MIPKLVDLEQIFKEVDDLDKDVVMDIIRTLVSIDTTVPPGDSYREYVDVISPYFEELGYNIKEVIVPDDLIKQIPYPLQGPRVNLVATKEFGQDQDITFFGHIDVVPAVEEGAEKWRFPPFEPTMIKSGKIYGRGVADMKGSMVCLILALQLIEKLHLTPKYNIRVLNCTDEEVGFYPGIRYLAEQGYVKGTAFCMDFLIDPIILMGAAGNLDVEVEAIGRSSHSGLSFLGVNALEGMVPILVELMILKKEVEERQTKDIPGFPRYKTSEKRNMTPLFNLDIIKAGKKSNIIPDLCRLTINRRIIPDEKYEDVKQEISDAIERGKQKSNLLEVKTTYKYDYPPLKVDINAPDIQRMKKVIKLVQNIPEEKIRIMGMGLTFDAGYVAQILGTEDYNIKRRGKCWI